MEHLLTDTNCCAILPPITAVTGDTVFSQKEAHGGISFSDDIDLNDQEAEKEVNQVKERINISKTKYLEEGIKLVMGKKILFGALFVLILASFVAGCGGTTTTTAPATSAPATTAPATTTAANWWDKFGEPQYGGTLTTRVTSLADNFDPMNLPWASNYFSYEVLFQADWTLPRTTYSFKIAAVPDAKWVVGTVVDSWTWKDDQTLTLTIKKGIKWQNKAPTNGREFVAEDVAYHYDQVFGTGHGFTKPNPFVAGWCSAIDHVVATGTYTADVIFKKPTPIANFFAISDFACDASMVPHELYDNPATAKDWHNATGTGAYMVSDFVTGSSLTYVRNPDYYGVDPRHPKNKLPYYDKVVMMCIPDKATAVAALRAGQLDMLNDVDWQTATNIKKTNPELIMDTRPDNGPAVIPRNDQVPFSDIKVRKALQLAVNIPEVASQYYGGNVPAVPVGLISAELKGWGTPYSEWPKSLQDEYKYDPTAAKKLLEEAGYPNGFKTTLYMSSTGSQEFAQIMQSYFKAINVDATISMMDNTAYSAFVIAAKYEGMVLNSWSNMCWPVGISMFNVTTRNVNNAMRQKDTTYDDYYDKFMNAKTSEEASTALKAGDQYAMQQHWQVVTTGGTYYNIWQPWLKGYSGEIMTQVGWDRHMYWMKLWSKK